MMNELFISKMENSIIIALKEDSKLVEISVDDTTKSSLVGNIYKARIEHISEGIQAAFVDIGEKKKAFLPLNTPDGKVKFEYFGEIDEDVENFMEIKEGDEILVQVVRDEINSKGAKLSSYISIAGNYLILVPFVHFIGVSKQIKDKEFKSSIKSFIYSFLPQDMGVIVRTAALDAKPTILKKEFFELLKIWDKIVKNIEKKKSPTLLYRESSLVIKTIRNLMKRNLDAIYVDSREIFNEVTNYLTFINPLLKSKVNLYKFKIPMLSYFEIDKEIEKMTKPEVYLKGGVSIVIETTEALTAIDVNSGKISKSRDDINLVKDINLMAAEEIARQLRLRDIGGLIVIDFIDMEDEQSRKEVFNYLKKCLKNDRSTTKTLKLSQFGLVEMTRKKIGPSVTMNFVEKCQCCDGRGYIAKPIFLGLKLTRWIKENIKNYTNDTLIINCNKELSDVIEKDLYKYFESLMKDYKVNIKIEKIDSFKTGYEIYSLNKLEKIAYVF
ncbi:MAG: Rne/Rng family ribonuclease [candidate division WOR-3 bacterium]